MKLIVVADDFTGANDTGVQLAKKGAKTEVMLSQKQKPSRHADVLVINTESRASTAYEATQAVTRALCQWCQPGEASPLVYKKIDSTFRGNIGAEVEAAMRATGKPLALIAGAIPGAGRTTEQGECRVHGVPLLETEFASDPRTPIISSRISTLIAQQSEIPVCEISLPRVRSGELVSALEQLAGQGNTMVVVDAVTDNDLELIARAAMSLSQTPLLVGAAGLANALPVSAWLTERRALPVLVVAGSMSEVTRRQVEQAKCSKRAEIVDIDVGKLLTSQAEDHREAVLTQACQLLEKGLHCILRTSREAEDRFQIDGLCQRHNLSRQQIGEQISRQLGLLTLAITGQARIGGLFLTGGDIAIAVANALGAEGYRIESEVAPCIPCGTFINSEIDDLPVITKAGGFGMESTLCDALYFIEEMYGDH
ncbi:D-threonate kinase [Cedecea colo]|uniref:Four-carbon acid sugar kinase family protein n=1 Tax=Cedecea colo TaxID=2552946 RepID=A0ABX0VMJ7_9ENTR|nr:four-carbon acid sugar kinase family protein [Cedecea colo]NIY48182.1 four-carbon acid sugar kinase family protein [Cedecea colo]